MKRVRPKLQMLNIAACHLCSSLAAKCLRVDLARVRARVLKLAETTLLTNLLQSVIKVEVLVRQWSHSHHSILQDLCHIIGGISSWVSVFSTVYYTVVQRYMASSEWDSR